MEQAVFIRVEAFALKGPSRNGSRRWSVNEIIKEMIREEGHCHHVEKPEKPEIIFGVDPILVEKEAQEIWQEAKKNNSRKTSKTSKSNLSGVASWPENIANYSKQKFKDWTEKVVKWLKNKYQSSLKTVLIHLDESNPHLHFLVLPDLNKNKEIDLSEVDEGQKIKKEAQASKRPFKETNRLFKEAMRKLKRGYWTECGLPFNHSLKSSKPRQRIDRQSYMQIKECFKEKQETLIKENEKLKREIELLNPYKQIYELRINNKKTLEALSSQRPNIKKIPSWVRD